ncbi:zeta toxin family protein [Nonomuraea sp. K274]|uniref:UDP-N-acetylglucosamine kinase n=1 Tax=Nonomuraea cypriaca TaxID=1187855 RepID=A0A931A5Q1_9ACTN|nr:zeta toxin family protein [Nonomuraea cypriaca]MBF8184533.1 zeta toxin family protein [Nonomuraea cypriaca]
MAGRDEALHFEAALDIIGSLMARCSAAEAGPGWRERRRGYLRELLTLDASDGAAVDQAITTYGAQLTELGGSLEVMPRSSPDDYRLTPEEHLSIFREYIVPDMLNTAKPSADPAALIVAGSPGTGKTTRVRRAARARAHCEAIDPEAFLAYHPRSWELVVQDDPAAGDRVMTDALGWCALAVERAIARRVDVVLEVGVNLPDDANDYAAVFLDAGYRVEVEMMAAAEAVSRLHLMLRYHCRHGDWRVLMPS